MAVPVTVSGRAGKGLIGVIPITITGWTVDNEADDVDGTTAEDDGFGWADYGVQQISGTLEGRYRIGVSKINPLQPGVGSTLKLYTYKIASDLGPFWDIPAFVVHGFQHRSQVRGEITFTCRFKSRGTYTTPVDPA